MSIHMSDRCWVQQHDKASVSNWLKIQILSYSWTSCWSGDTHFHGKNWIKTWNDCFNHFWFGMLSFCYPCDDFMWMANVAQVNYMYLVTDRVPEIGFSGTQIQPKNGFTASWIKLFFIFCQIFGIFDDFSVSPAPSAAYSMLKNHQICQRLFNLP